MESKLHFKDMMGEFCNVLRSCTSTWGVHTVVHAQSTTLVLISSPTLCEAGDAMPE
jgi:hypothetical protein